MIQPVETRFWASISPEPNSGCWLWTGRTAKFGHGRIGVGGEYVNTHRLSWELHRGPIPDGLWVLHKCDVPPCCNPDHLFLGTRADNMADAARKNRLRHGVHSHHAKLTPEGVLWARAEHARGALWKDIAATLGVHPVTAMRAAKGESWVRVGGDPVRVTGERRCAAEDCETIFVISSRVPLRRFCTTRCWDRTRRRKSPSSRSSSGASAGGVPVASARVRSAKERVEAEGPPEPACAVCRRWAEGRAK